MLAYAREQPLEFKATEAGGTVTVVLGGDLDAGNERALRRRLARIMQRRPRRLVFEMARVGYIDCACARAIVETERSLPAGTRPGIRHPQPVVLRLLRLTGLDARCDLDLDA